LGATAKDIAGFNRSENATEKAIQALRKQKASAEKGRVTLYVDKVIYREFQRECAKYEVPASLVVTHFMENFLGSAG
jgi:hypothetical protein